eukprot:SAG11_NODE_2285_length_3571_cov_2.005184_2_plen_93_part_00
MRFLTRPRSHILNGGSCMHLNDLTPTLDQFFEDLRFKCSKCWPQQGPYTGDVSTRTCDDISERWPGAAPPVRGSFQHAPRRRVFLTTAPQEK